MRREQLRRWRKRRDGADCDGTTFGKDRPSESDDRLRTSCRVLLRVRGQPDQDDRMAQGRKAAEAQRTRPPHRIRQEGRQGHVPVFRPERPRICSGQCGA